MKKVFAYFFLVAFCTSVADAADSVTISRSVTAAKPQSQPVETNVSRTAIPRNVATQSPVEEPTASDVVNSQVISRTATASQNTDTARGSSTATRAGISRSVVAGTANSRDNLESAVSTIGRNARVTAASINSDPALRRAGISLRPSTAEVGGRATLGNSKIQTGSNIRFNEQRSVQSRAATTVTAESILEATERLQQTADLNKSCQAQYNDCMDQFCAVIDNNQKRCSCSSNLSRYTRVESAVKDANVQLNEVAQRIRYVGLSADEIRSIMSATEAEIALDRNRDNTESRSMLDEIEKLIKNPTSATSSYSGNSFSGLDIDLDFSGDASDLFSLDFLGNDTASFSNLRGTELHNAAKKRCSVVLTQCKNAGATQQQITGNYDLAIDKDCIAYEQGLQKMNDTLKNNVRSAGQMLQKARLAVLQNKNQYDAKGCIAALNTCMVDDMVCGSDYAKCLDPTKKYIDENGNVILGQNISNITRFMDDYDNSMVNKSFLSASKTVTLSESSCQDNAGQCTVRYLLEKIGTGKTVTEGGLCRAVLDKCQQYTYNTSNNVYEPYNDVVVNYIQRAMVNIKAAQYKIISDYASSCMVDIATCYNQQVSQVNSWSSSASTSSVYNVMRGACRNVALTCAYAVFARDVTACPLGQNLTDQGTCIDSVSEMFYQSLLCPENSTYQADVKADADPAKQPMYVNDRCLCDDGYDVWNKTCQRKCHDMVRDYQTGRCVSCAPGKQYSSDVGMCITCNAGLYCPNGVPLDCPPGYYCPQGTVDTPLECPANSYCAGNTPTPVLCSTPANPGPEYSCPGSTKREDCIANAADLTCTTP